MTDLKVPEYRVRLFLSVDLTGSTAFKSKNDSFIWLKAFQHFYGEFPKNYAKQYGEICSDVGSISDFEKKLAPKIWKTIGDEILFVNRVYSITHLGAYVAAFSKSLHEFGAQVQNYDGLNTKGNGWLAAFPSPNCSIGVSEEGQSDPMSGLDELRSEEFECCVDENPQKFDFLGKGIDGGFRIARNSTVNTFTISPALAFLLTKAKGNSDATGFDADFRFHEPQKFKGVVSEKPYPIISIDTTRSQDERELMKLENQLLQKPNMVNNYNDLKCYLEKYIKINKIEMPSLKLLGSEDEQEAPSYYTEYTTQWEKEKTKADQDLASLSEDGNSDNDAEIPTVAETAQKFTNS